MIAPCPVFTEDQWLDGIIWSCGSKASLRSVRLRVGDLPCSLMDMIQNRFEEIGYETDLVEIPNAITRENDLVIVAVSPEEVFTNLPRYAMRRILASHPHDFCDGFIIARIAPRRLRAVGEYERDFSFDKIRLRINCGDNRHNIEEILDERGHSYEIRGPRGLELSPECYVHEPFRTYLSALEIEYNSLGSDLEDGEDTLVRMQDEAVHKRRSLILKSGMGDSPTQPVELSDDALAVLNLLKERPRTSTDLLRFFGDGYVHIIQDLRNAKVGIVLTSYPRYELIMEKRLCDACGYEFESVQGMNDNLCLSCRDAHRRSSGDSLFG